MERLAENINESADPESPYRGFQEILRNSVKDINNVHIHMCNNNLEKNDSQPTH